MTVRPFVMWPDKRLRTVCAPVAEVTNDIRRVWVDMVDTMDAMPGIGLGAPQIGVMLQLAVVDVTPDRSRRILLANPQILSTSEELHTRAEASPCLLGVEADITRPNAVSVRSTSEELHTRAEASPCLPGVEADITRPNAVSVRYLGEAGMIERRDFEGLEARSVQHQIDHLAGRMYFDNLGRVKRDMLLRRARKKR